MITYREVGNMGMSSGRIKVYLDGRYIGHIVAVLNGYRYYSKGYRIGGDTFPTVAQVKRSLEAA